MKNKIAKKIKKYNDAFKILRESMLDFQYIPREFLTQELCV